jgi:hypothetical protein
MTAQSDRKQEEQERENAKRRQEERQLDKELQDSFPASDPPAIVQPTPSPEKDDKHKGDKTRRHSHT